MEINRGMNKFVVVTRKTRLQELISKYNTLEQARFYIEHLGADFSDYVEEDRLYNLVLNQVLEIADTFGRVQQINRNFLPTMIFGKQDIVIAVGQDGLMANIMKYLDNQPLIGVNPDKSRWAGVLLPFEAFQLKKLLPRVVLGDYDFKQVTMAEAVTADGRKMLAVNDLFIGCKTHTSARYNISLNSKQENHSSSGIIISTGLGATGWHQSIITQFNQMATMLNCGKIQYTPLSWEENQLTFVVREPYPSCATQSTIVFGKIGKADDFKIVSKMPTDGVVFSDGIEEDAISFTSGMEIIIQIADKKGKIVV